MKPEGDKKIAIICSGGGMRCAYSAGALMALVEKYNFTEPHVLIGSSGSAGTVAYFVTKQYDSLKKAWLNMLSTKKLISPWRIWNILDINYLVDTIFRKQVPLEVDALKDSPIKYFIGVRNLENGLLEYHGKESYLNIFNILKASTTMPLVSHSSVRINGNRCVDGFMGTNINEGIEKVRNEGASTVILIDNSSVIKSRMEFIFLRVYALLTPGHMGGILKNYLYNGVRNRSVLNDEGIIYIKPKHGLYANMFNNSKERLKKTYQMGYNDTVDSKEIQALFSQK